MKLNTKTWLKYFKFIVVVWFLGQALFFVSAFLSNRMISLWNPSTSAFMHADMMRHWRIPRHTWRPIENISPNLIRAILVAEDDRFFQHEGLDWDALEKSWELNQKKGRAMRGGSTITMQLAKNLYLNSQKSYFRKAKEILLTWDLERSLSKERILEIYLNLVQLGPGLYGVEAASQHYFNKSAVSLSRRQASYLAAILPNPVYLTSHAKGRVKRRQQIILRRMRYKKLPTLE